MTRCRPRTSALLALALAAGCGSSETGGGGGAPPAAAPPYDRLSEYGYFEPDLSPAPGVVPYEVAAALWADHAGKRRFVALPPRRAITFDEGEDWQFPVGSAILKEFEFPLDLRDPEGASRLIETRLLLLTDEGWTGHTYVWNDDLTEAYRTIAGKRVSIDFTGEDGEPRAEDYLVPNTNQCDSCHERDDALTFLGTVTHQVNRDVEVDGQTVSQLDWLAGQGLFDAPLPPADTLPRFEDPFGDGPLDVRARSYLHANCSHCHRPGGGGGPSGLVLLAWEQDLSKVGVCKIPAAAGAGAGGRDYDIVPGAPGESVIPFRMSSVDAEIKMPELPNRIVDERGVALIEEWIASLEPKGCE
jgi:uncharacterized repeat protein (TIGR03806 family)